MRKKLTLLLVIISIIYPSVFLQKEISKSSPLFSKKVVVYKTIGEIKLHLHIFEPKKEDVKTQLPAIVLFHGGGWRSG